ncbi:MAG: hypothetical protein JRH15_04355 [Deltaproteobacteria bacterium]|nr:hypothetical protein [Deltaproteobacteria bacterium]
MASVWKKWVCASLIVVVLGCGYRFAGSGELPAGVQSVSLAGLDNRTAETGLESIVNNDIIYELTRNGKIFTGESARADAYLSGVIRSIRTRSISRRSTLTAQERRVTMTVSLQLADPVGKLLWQSDNMIENEEYVVLPDKAATEQNKKAAIKLLSKRLAERIYYRLTDNF